MNNKTRRRPPRKRSFSLYFVVFLIFAIDLAQAASATVFGPVIYEKTRRTHHQIDHFSVANPNASHLLMIDNGNFGATKPAVGKILLNGVATRLDKNTPHIEKPVGLLSDNTVTANLKGQIGTRVYVAIRRVDNFPPVANAGLDQTPYAGDVVTLDGSASSDGDGDLINYSWSLLSKPLGSNTVVSNPDTVFPSLRIDRFGIYAIQLIVHDGVQNSVPDTVSISTLNSAPVADAGVDRTPFAGDRVTLDGSASSDVDGDRLTLYWLLTAKPAASRAGLNGANSAHPDFDVDQPGHYSVELTVHDGTLDSEPDNVSIDTRNSRPVANAGDNQSLSPGQKVSLDGSASFDVDNHPLTFDWSLITVPDGSAAALNNPASARPDFRPDLPGPYVSQLIVNDGFLNSDPDTVGVDVQARANNPPLAAAGTGQTARAGQAISLDGSASSDPDGDPLSYGWTLIASPAGSTASLSGDTTTQPGFTPDVGGTYTAQLIVNDGAVNSAPATVDITVSANTDPVIVSTAVTDATVNILYSYDVDASDADADTPSYSLAVSPAGMSIDSGTGLSQWTPAASGDFSVTVKAADGFGGQAPQSYTITVQSNTIPGIPPDPATVAPPLDPTVATTVYDASQFLYSGANPIQTGVAPGASTRPRRGAARAGAGARQHSSAGRHHHGQGPSRIGSDREPGGRQVRSGGQWRRAADAQL